SSAIVRQKYEVHWVAPNVEAKTIVKSCDHGNFFVQRLKLDPESEGLRQILRQFRFDVGCLTIEYRSPPDGRLIESNVLQFPVVTRFALVEHINSIGTSSD